MKCQDNLSRLENLISLNPDKFEIDLVNFLHELKYCKSFDEFVELVYSEPKKGLTDEFFNYVIVAGIIEFFALRNGYDAPSWIYDTKYVLENEWWALDDDGEYKKWLTMTSPPCFRKRNIFINGETLIPI